LKKYKTSLSDHIPYDGFALGEYLIELPNFSEQIKNVFLNHLKQAKKHYELATAVGKEECILYEFDFDLKDAL